MQIISEKNDKSTKNNRSDYVHLHVHTEYSLLKSTIKIDQLMKQASAYNMPALAITDSGNLFGAVEFFKKAKKNGIKPIIGCEVYVAPGSRLDRSKPTMGYGLSEDAAFHLILLTKNTEGYKNLTTLVSKAYLEGFYYTPRIDKKLLEQHSSGLIGLSACLKGEVPFFLSRGQKDKAREAALSYKHIFGTDNFYLELQHNGIPKQEAVNRMLVELSRELDIPIVATNDCHYLKRDDTRVYDILPYIQTGSTVKHKKRMTTSINEFSFKSPDEMKEAFRDLPEAILNTRLIAEKCNFEFVLWKKIMPEYKLPKGISPDAYLKEKAFEGLKNKFGTNPRADYVDRLEMELKVISEMGYTSYFLIVWDFINYARENGIPVGPGKGTSPCSLATYCLDITEIDPLKYNLIFERFLNPDRIGMPDICVDFCKDRRQEVINYISQKYGSECVAQIITFETMAANAAIRAVGRSLNIPNADVDRIANLISENTTSIGYAIQTEQQLKDIYENNQTIRGMLDIAKKLEDLPCHTSTHAAGVVIAPSPLTEYTAFYKNPSEDVITTQFDMRSIEEIGLLKFDFHGLLTLTVIEKAIEYIRQQGKSIDLSRIPLDDPKTYNLLISCNTTGIFQFESPGMKDILVRMQPSRFEDLMALVALYRPGPMAWIDDFIRRKKGETEIFYELPQLKKILEETYGIILYQEQVMMIANEIASFSMGQADILRRVMGKKKSDEMEKQKEIFIQGAVNNKIPKKKAAELFLKIALFASYSFNKSHAAAYAYLAYRTAYLKTHFPIEFMKANLSSDCKN